MQTVWRIWYAIYRVPNLSFFRSPNQYIFTSDASQYLMRLCILYSSTSDSLALLNHLRHLLVYVASKTCDVLVQVFANYYSRTLLHIPDELCFNTLATKQSESSSDTLFLRTPEPVNNSGTPGGSAVVTSACSGRKVTCTVTAKMDVDYPRRALKSI